MTGWLWCHGATGWCSICQTLKRGVWLHYASATTSDRCVCETCAEELGPLA